MLIASRRRGFTLVEIMLSMVMLLMVSGAIYQLILTTQGLSRTQAEQVARQSSARGAALVVANELRELSTVEGGNGAQNDILSLAPHAVSYRAVRGWGYTCQALGASVVRLGRNQFTGHRDPQPGRDSALVLVEGSAGAADSGWIPVAITSVSTASPCAGTGGPGITLTISGPALPVLPAGTPLRIYELMELALYRSDGHSWLGMRSVSSGEAIQPIFGPLADADGFRLDYAGANGTPTSVAAAVKSITVTVRAVSESASSPGGSGPGSQVELLTTTVALRNANR